MNFSCPLTASAGDPVRTRLRSVWRDSNVWPLLAGLPPPSNTVRSAASVSPTLTRRSCPATSACRAARCWPCPPSRQRTPSTSPRPCPPAQSRDQDPQTGPLCTAIRSSINIFKNLSLTLRLLPGGRRGQTLWRAPSLCRTGQLPRGRRSAVPSCWSRRGSRGHSGRSSTAPPRSDAHWSCH